MCGITGFWNLDGKPADAALLDLMTDSVAHRGPDGRGTFIDGSVALGHRRLSVIDVVGSPQPMSYRGRFTITFNGEIYNYRELRSILLDRGHVFRTQGDTEVIMAAYAEWGTDCPSKLRGMFVFAIWDAHAHSLFLARDRVGKKSIYYCRAGGTFAFGSELKTLLPLPAFERHLNPQAVWDYLTLQYIPDPLTIWEGASKLEPATWLLIQSDGTARTARYWQLNYTKTSERKSEREWRQETRRALGEAVRVRLESEVPLGVHLSGGVDSSAVVALMRRHVSGRLRTFSIGFQEQEYNELKYARAIARRFETDHEEFIVESDMMSVLPDLVRSFDEPFADSAALPTWFLSKLTRERVTVVLNGDGGDESFAGYERHRGRPMVNALRRLPGFVRRHLLKPSADVFARLFPSSAAAENAAYGARVLNMNAADYYAQYLTLMRAHQKQSIVARDFQSRVENRNSWRFIEAAYRNTRNASEVERRMHVDIQTYLPGALLPKVDRTTMAFGLEARSPLLDHVLMEHAASIPSSVKFRDGVLKRHLKNTLRGLIPDKLLDRRKSGFTVPIRAWFRGPRKEWLRDVLLSPEARRRGVFNPGAVEKLWRQHTREGQNHEYRLWVVLMFELWAREYLGSH